MSSDDFSFNDDDFDFDDLPEFGEEDSVEGAGTAVAEEEQPSEEQEEAMQNLTDQAQEKGMGYETEEEEEEVVDEETGEVVDWVDEETGDFEGDEEFPEVDTEDTEDQDELPVGLQHALKAQGVEPEKLSVEKAISYVKTFDEGVNKHKEQVMLLRWQQGLIAAATPVRYDEQTMERLSEATGVHENTLREAKRLVEEFNYNVGMFKDWIREPEGKIRRWYEVQDLIRDTTPEPDDTEEEVERKREKLISKVETLTNTLEKINGIIKNAESEDEEVQREVEGVTLKALGEIRRFMQTRFYENAEWDGDTPIPRSDQFKDFVLDFPDPITGMPADDPAHTSGKRGTGIKASDFTCIPLTRTHHDELHQKGQQWFEEEYNVNLDKIRFEMLHRFVTGTWADLNLPTPDDL